MGVTPKVQVPRGDEVLHLTLKAEGYQPDAVEVTPSEDRAVTVTMEKVVAAATPPAEKPDRKKGKKRPRDLKTPDSSTTAPPSGETVEDPFKTP